jgi:anti-sigma regulatory factor (Ser/Thr protein kinase)
MPVSTAMPMHPVRRDEMSRRAVSPAAQALSATPSGWIASKEWTGKHVTGGLTIELERTHPVVRMRASGVLGTDTATDLSAALFEAVAEQAAGVLIEVDDLAVTGDAGPLVFATLGAQNQTWPGCGLVLAGPNDTLQAALERLGILSYVSICPDRPTALEHLARLPVPPWRRVHIAADRDAPGLARHTVAEFCSGLGIGGGAMGGETAQLVASELVTNAVVHAGTPIELTLRLVWPMLHIAVRDSGDGQAQIAGFVDESAESGRGLVLVDALASSWGNFVPPVGKVVWATVLVRSVSVVP